jgi:GTP-sensing pleiotropic transcriptional regulator CodY
MEQSRRDSGEFTQKVEDADLLAAVDEIEAASTTEVGERVGLTRQAADNRLRQLRDADRVRSKKIGASLVWLSADD